MNMTDSNTHCWSRSSVIRRWMIGRRLKKLKLDHSQVEKLDELILSTRSVSNGCFSAKSELKECIGTMLTDDDFSHEKAAVCIRTAAEQHTERTVEIVAAFGEFYQGLEPGQQQQLQALLQRRLHRASRCCH